ncbi:MAG: hypothetical protein JRI68_16025, partial [Deltaproteobacteria bacterium]|nr:hypothetical protein [Deltaproteobacteria bacterium]
DDGTACDDSVFCTVQDACAAGICVGGPENDCGMTPGQCLELYCDENSQTCGEQAAAPGAACQDPNDLCVKGATCNNGLCTGGTTEDCFMQPVPDDCHVSECNPQNGLCEPVVGNEGGPCTDANDLCTVSKTCAAGVCQGGSPKDCSSLTLDCVLGVCDVNNGQCTTQALNNGDPCDDLDPCTSGELCNNGSCAGGAPVVQCTNGDSCCPSNCTVQNDQDCAIVELDIGVFGSNFTGTNMTRGYWFQAPTAFTIKGLRVPTDVGTAPQNVQVVRFNSGAPTGGSNTNFTTLHYSSNIPGNNWIPMNIPVQSGQWIGILGARGTTTMNNSYATNWFYNTTILGYATMLTRMYYQGNLYSLAATTLGTESSGSYSRVEMQYGP